MFNLSNAFAEIGKTQLNALLHLSNLSLRGATRLSELQIAIAREVWLESAKTWQPA